MFRVSKESQIYPKFHMKITFEAKDELRLNAISSKNPLWIRPWHITKTYLYNIDPIKPHFYIVKLGFTGIYIILLFLLKNIDCGYSLEPPRFPI